MERLYKSEVPCVSEEKEISVRRGDVSGVPAD